jgi:hypothetical protein
LPRTCDPIAERLRLPMAPRFTIGRTVLVHGVGYFIPPAIMLGVYYGFGYNTTDEEKRKMLEVKYEHQIRKAEAGKKNMQAFFDKVKAGDEELDQRLNGVLQAGNKKVVRHYHVDGDIAAKAQKAGSDTIGAAAAMASTAGRSDQGAGAALHKAGRGTGVGGTRIEG